MGVVFGFLALVLGVCLVLALAGVLLGRAGM